MDLQEATQDLQNACVTVDDLMGRDPSTYFQQQMGLALKLIKQAERAVEDAVRHHNQSRPRKG